MVKQFILLIQLIGVFFYQLVLTGDVTVSQTIPNSIEVGTEAIVQIKVNKSDATGFAKVQQDIPAGFNVEALETKGATFSFKENRLKFIWMSLPSEEEFTISYKLKPTTATPGNFSIGGKFSFIADSERKNVVIPESAFEVTEGQVVADLPEDDTPVENDTPETEEPNNTENEEPVVVEPPTEKPVENAIELLTQRTIEDNGNGKYMVSVKVNKQGIEGFAKITETIPNGFVASEGESKGGVFSFKEGNAKILWMAIPRDEEFILTYSLQATTAENGAYDVTGEFAYLENDETKKIITDKTAFNLAIEAVADETPEADPIEEPIVEKPNEEEPIIEEPIAEEDPIAENTITEEDDNNKRESDITSVPSAETNISYKVQVGAGHQQVAANYFAVRFNLKDNVSTENHEGWIKYLVGSFSEYKAARDKRNTVRNNVKTAFVIAYNSGKRITVQEALMISNQKWYK